MATRSGTVDPGVLLWLLRHGFEPAALEDLLYRKSGLLGLSGISGDMRRLLDSDEPNAALAVEVFVYQCAKAIASIAAPLEGLQAVVFTGGIGEHSPEVRAMIAARCGWLGLHLDDWANRRNAPRISSADSGVSAWVVANDEERLIATQALACMRSAQP
jgi:acetate kinase